MMTVVTGMGSGTEAATMSDADNKLQHDEWGDVCPICAQIVEYEVWPREVECGTRLDSPEVSRGELAPPCPVCGNETLMMNWLTMPTKAGRGFVHNMILYCPSCDTGMRHDGTDAVTNKPKIVGKWPVGQFPPREMLMLKGFFRVRNFPCLDDGWDAMGTGVRPLDRSEIMQRFYEWTNDEAVALADDSTNPLRTVKKKREKKYWWS